MYHIFFLLIFKVHAINPLSNSPTKWLNTLKQFVDNLSTNSLSVFDQFVGLALKGLMKKSVLSIQLEDLSFNL